MFRLFVFFRLAASVPEARVHDPEVCLLHMIPRFVYMITMFVYMIPRFVYMYQYMNIST